MATHKSAAKKSKVDEKRNERNRAGKSRLRTALKKFREALNNDPIECVHQLPFMESLIDKSVKHGFIHKNAGSRLKSRLSRHVNAAIEDLESSN